MKVFQLVRLENYHQMMIIDNNLNDKVSHLQGKYISFRHNQQLSVRLLLR